MDSKAALMDAQACYAAVKSHDARFDGRLFVGVSSTGIYCRPVCRVKTPKAANCTFFSSAAAAEAAGYRPCLKCRPELAPGNSAMDAVSRVAHAAVLAMEEGGLEEAGISGLAERLGVTDRHLRRAFWAEYGVAPVRYLQTCRLLLAKSLLTDTALPVTHVALAAGFGSIRRFNAAFKGHYRLSPRDLRKTGRAPSPDAHDGVRLFLGYRPPYQWEKMLAFLEGRAIPGVESVEEGAYRRTAALRKGETVHQGWIGVRNAPERSALAVTVAPALLPVLPQVLARVRALFDVDCHPWEIAERLCGPEGPGPGLFTPGTRLPGCFDPFEMAVRAVLGQQVTVKAARTLAMRFARAFGEPLATPLIGLTHIFPSPERIAALPAPVEDQLGPLGITGARARCLFALAGALSRGEIRLERNAEPEATMRRLLALPGFGPWTAQYVAMRALAWPDAFPHIDYGVKKALEGLSPETILKIAEKWRPWRAYATLALWDSLANQRPATGKGA